MAGYFKINDQWRQVKTGFRKVNDQWKEMKEGHYNDNGRWVQVLGEPVIPDELLDLCSAYYDSSDRGTLWADTAGKKPASVDSRVLSISNKCGGDPLLAYTRSGSVYGPDFLTIDPVNNITYMQRDFAIARGTSGFDLTKLVNTGLPILIGIPNVGVVALEKVNNIMILPSVWSQIIVVKDPTRENVERAIKLLNDKQRLYSASSVTSLKKFSREGNSCIGKFFMFDTSRITNMSYMFEKCVTFNQPVNFDTRNVTEMTSMFDGCKVFNQPVIFSDTSKVVYMSMLFNGCTAFNQSVNINASSADTLFGLFAGCKSFNQPVIITNTSKVKDLSMMFNSCGEFNQPLSLVNWDLSSATNMKNMFTNVQASADFDLSGWYVPLIPTKPVGFYMPDPFQPKWGQKDPNMTPEPPKPLDPILDPNQNFEP